MLDGEGRQAYQQMPEDWLSSIDTVRAQSEIALLERNSMEVYYGLDALSIVLTHRYSFLKPLLAWKPLRWLLQRLYFFISYNRKVIAAARPSPGALQDCKPAYNFKYRMLYLAVAWVVSVLLWSQFLGLLKVPISFNRISAVFLLLGGSIVFQWIILMGLNREKLMDYLGNLLTVSLIGALMLLPAIVLNALFAVQSASVFTVYLVVVILLQLLEHLRRMHVLELSILPTFTWLIYHAVIVAGILLL